MNGEEFTKKLLKHILINYRYMTRYADHLGVSKAYISAVVSGKKPPSKAILKDIGMERIATITYIDNSQ